jgi:hypothetical protein
MSCVRIEGKKTASNIERYFYAWRRDRRSLRSAQPLKNFALHPSVSGFERKSFADPVMLFHLADSAYTISGFSLAAISVAIRFVRQFFKI